MNFSTRLAIFCYIIFFILCLSCDRVTSPPNQNEPPNTSIANIPKENDTIFALVTLHWDGEDNDGFISGYQYRYITYHLIKGDSVVQEWRDTKETSLTLAFNSSDLLNKQRFQVRSIDNNGDIDPSPAEKVFYTKQTVFPKTSIISPTQNQEMLVSDKVTDWWQGVTLAFSARDEDGSVIEYAWAVDDDRSVDQVNWTWTKDTVIHVTPDKFKQPLTGDHILRVTCRDNTFLIDPTGATVTVKLLKPDFSKRVLIIDETDESNFPSGVQAGDVDVDNYYSELFNTTDNWDYRQKGAPPRSLLAQYKLVVWHADDRPTFKPHALPANIEVIKDYLNVGGKFIMSGWRILKSFAWDRNFPVAFSKGSFVYDYLHILTADETSLDGDFTGAVGVGENFSDIKVDGQKLADVFPYYGKLGQINIIPQKGGFTDIMYSYKNEDSSPYYMFRGRACGLRYYGTVFDAVVLGFPMFFIDKSDSRVMVKEVLKSMGIN